MLANPILDWTVETASLAESKTPVAFDANEAERLEMARVLDVASIENVTFKGTVRRLRKDRFHVEGVLTAHLTQLCVVTLDPIESEVREDVSQHFWPIDQLPKPGPDEEVDPFDTSAPEPVRSGKLELGQLLYEIISAQIDPYPRKEGEELGEVSAGDGDDDAANPFSVLKNLQDN